MGCPFGCSYSVQCGGIVYVGYYVYQEDTYALKNSKCNPNQLGGFAYDYIREFPIEVNPNLGILDFFFNRHTHFDYCHIPPRRAISDPHLLERITPLHPISSANGLTLISPYAGPLFRSPRSGHWWNSCLCPGDYTLSYYNLYSNRLSGEHVIFWGIDSVK